MSEVSCRGCQFLFRAEEAGIVDLEDCLIGLPTTRAYIENQSNRLSWDLFLRIVDRMQTQLSSRDEVIAVGKHLVDPDYLGTRFTKFVLNMVADPMDLYRIIWQFGIPNNFRCTETTFEKLSDNQLQLGITLKPGYRECEAWFLATLGALPKVPSVLRQDLDDAIVLKSKITPRSIDVVLRVPMSNRLFARTRRLVGTLRSPTAMYNELEFQQQQLSDSYVSMQKNESDFRRAFEALPILVAFHRDGYVLYANPAMCRSLGYEKGEMVGVLLTDLVRSIDHHLLQRLTTADSDTKISLKLTHRNGRQISVETRVEHGLTQGGKSCSAIYATDVSDRNKARTTIEMLLRASTDLIIRTNLKGEILDIQGGKDFAIPKEAPGSPMDVTRILAQIPGINDEAVARTWLTLERAIDECTKISHLIVGGSGRFYDFQLMPDVNKCALLTIRNVSEAYNQERQMARSDRLISLGTLIAGVGHEINNPLAYILGNTQILEEEFSSPAPSFGREELAEMVGEISEGAERISKIVASLRRFNSSVEAQDPEPVDIEAVMERAIQVASPHLGLGVYLTRDYQNPPATIAAAAQLEQVVINLIVNAAQARRETGDLRITLSTRTEGNNTVFVISDDGKGIRESHIERVFDAFYTTRKVGEGTGLGLSIAHRIVESVGGTMRVKSEFGKGSSFIVSLPSAHTMQVKSAQPENRN